MNHDEIEKAIGRLGPWFHNIDLPGGLRTKSASVAGEPIDHPRGTWKILRDLLPQRLDGKSVLDVGCNGGFYSVEAKRRGAARVMGVDVARMHVRQARFVARALDLDLEVRRSSVYDLSPATHGRFDITLALGLVYHLKHLVLGLERLWQVTREVLILETAVYPPSKLPRPFQHPIAGKGRTIHAFGYVANPAEASESAFNWFLPGVAGLVALLENVGFERVEVASVVGERAVLVCRQPTELGNSLGANRLAARLETPAFEVSSLPGELLRLPVRVENTGQRRWLSRGEGGTERGEVRLGAHLFRGDEEELDWDFARAGIPRDLMPGESADLELHVQAPAEPGRYLLELDMVAEHVAWFEDCGSPIVRLAWSVSN